MRKFLDWLTGGGFCPSCSGELVEVEAGHHVCECGVVVDYTRGGWMYASESEFRRLPGIAGLPWDRDRSKAA